MSECVASRQRLLRIFAAALSAVAGHTAVRRALTRRPINGSVWVCAIGKAAESMALGAADVCGDALVGGLLITKVGHLNPSQLDGLGIASQVGGHPIPDAGSLDAGRRLLAALHTLPHDNTLLFLLSGGASSLVDVPTRGRTVADLQRMNQWLLGSGLPIDAMNLVRKAVSQIKAGGLLSILNATAGQRRVMRQLAISDVPGDVPSVIGSGLLVPEDDLAQSVSRLELPAWLLDWVRQGLSERAGRRCPIRPDRVPEMELVATLADARGAALDTGRQEGLRVWLHETFIAGDAAARGRRLARILIDSAPGLHVWGGETTVRLPPSPGRGGRNQHLALAAAIELAGHEDCLLLSAGTDGTDGSTTDAGALVDGGTLARARADRIAALEYLDRADAGSLLEISGDLIHTGATGTNVMDLILGLKP